MPLESPEDFDRLGGHLCQIDAPLAEFAASHGYTVYPRLSGGRYPNRRITEEGDVMRSIHISMDHQEDGTRFDHFFPEIPYTIWGGVWFDENEKRTRWCGPSIWIERVPFSALVAALPLHLRHFHDYLALATRDYIKACACTSILAIRR